MKRILINATQAEELRVAMVNGQLLYDLDIEVPSREQKKSNIYKGVITRVEPSLEAAFVDYGADRHGFLPFKEISRDYFTESARNADGKVSIKEAIKVDQEIIVQVEKEERGNKGAALTSFISLAGRFLVAMPQNPRAGGVSRRIEGDDRDQIRDVMAQLEMPKGMGVIARTAGVGRTAEEMQWDLDYLVQVWDAITKAAAERSGAFLIYQESDIVIRALRDHYKSDVGEILIDSKKAFDRAHEFMAMVMPNALHKLKFFDEKQPLFNRFQIENQIESAFVRTVNLPSGGAIVVDHTEALTSIDVNSARATKGGDIEETALNTNLEAADEIARQLRIRDLGGLLVIDFIDMMKNKNQREVETRLRRAVQEDRARVQIGRISRFGLLEMSRQRLRPSLGESSQIVCPRCLGQGTIRDVESLSLAVLRLLEEEALKENTGRILTRLPVECATYLLNEKRDKIASIEERCKVACLVVPDPNLETPHFQIERIRDNDTHRHESSYKNSYELTSETAPVYTPDSKAQSAPPQQPAVQLVAPAAPKPASAPPPAREEPKDSGLISKVITALFGSGEKDKQEEEAAPKKPASSQSRSRSSNRRGSSPSRGRGGRSAQNRSGGRDPKSASAKSADKSDGKKSEDDNQTTAKTGENRQSRSKSRGGRSRGGRSRGSRQGSDKQQQNTADKQQDKQTETGQGNAATDANSAKPSQKSRSRGGSRSRKPRDNVADANKDANKSKDQANSQPEAPGTSGKAQNAAPSTNSDQVEKPKSAPVETRVDKPVDNAASKSAGNSAAKSADDSASKPVDKPATKAADKPQATPDNQPKAKPATSSPAPEPRSAAARPVASDVPASSPTPPPAKASNEQATVSKQPAAQPKAPPATVETPKPAATSTPGAPEPKAPA
jgi:ribonuclease E